MQNIFNRLKNDFSAKQTQDYIEITIPIVTWVNGALVTLRIVKSEENIIIYSPTNLFLEANAGGDQSYYFDIFEKHDKNYHYDINLKDGNFSKTYSADTNIAVAINEFVRFFILLDDFILNNDVIGNEEIFE